MEQHPHRCSFLMMHATKKKIFNDKELIQLDITHVLILDFNVVFGR